PRRVRGAVGARPSDLPHRRRPGAARRATRDSRVERPASRSDVVSQSPRRAEDLGGSPLTAVASAVKPAELALTVREHVIRMTQGGGCFLGGSLSCTDLIVHLYTSVLRISPQTVNDPDRDYLLLSKGHDVPALYGTLAELGYFPRSRLSQHLSPEDHIYWH